MVDATNPGGGPPNGGRSPTDIQAVLRGILRAARNSVSEEDLRVRAEPVFRDYFTRIGVTYEPRYEKIVGFAGRTDALFGKVITEYKRPNYLRTEARIAKAFKKLRLYLKTEAKNAGDDVRRYAGILLDGRRVGFIRKRAAGWSAIGPVELNVANVKLLLEYYRSLSRKPLEPAAIALGLGSDSDHAKETIQALLQQLRHPAGKTKLLFAEWRRLFGQVSGYENYQVEEFDAVALAYGLANDPDGLAKWLFATHTYFAVVIKLIGAEILTIHRGGRLESYVEKLAVLSGENLRGEFRRLEDDHVFGDLGVNNFLEGDFFSWYLDSWSPAIERQLLAVARHLLEYEPATSIFEPEHVRDLLKNLYQNLVPRTLRHDLGEFYTPDWLAEYVLDGVGYDGNPAARLLDPSCGSGTFLVLALRRAKDAAERAGVRPADAVRQMLRNVVGFDLNPLAVIAARTNYLLAIGDYLRETEERLEIPVYLSDSIFSPRRGESGEWYEYFIITELRKIDVNIPPAIVERGLVGKAMNAIERSVVGNATRAQCLKRLKVDLPTLGDKFWDGPGQSLLHIFDEVAKLENVGWNRIWCRIIKNRYASAAVGHFGFVVGNPAWVRWSRLPPSYRETVKHVCEGYDIFSRDSWVGGIESDISTILTYAAADKWLTDGGRLGFVITQTVFKSKSSEGFRRFELPDGTPLRVDSVDDMVAIKPFENADNRSSVLFLTRGQETNYPVEYREWSKTGRRLPPESSSLADILDATARERLVAFPLADENNAWVTCVPGDVTRIKAMVGHSTYEGRKCVTSDLNNAYWVRLTGNRRGRLVEIENNLDRRATAVPRFVGVIEPEIVYPLVRGKDVGAFRWERSDRYVIVPQRGMVGFPEEDMIARYQRALDYFARYRRRLEQRSSYRRYLLPINAPYYSLWNVGPYTFSPYKVVWREIGIPVQAAVLSPVTDDALGDRVAIPDHKLMMVPCQTAGEAHFLCAVINSELVQRLLRSVVVATQVGARVLDNIRIPDYDAGDGVQRQLAELSAEMHMEGEDDGLPGRSMAEVNALVRKLFA